MIQTVPAWNAENAPQEVTVTLNVQQSDGTVLVLTKPATSVTWHATEGRLDVALYVNEGDVSTSKPA